MFVRQVRKYIGEADSEKLRYLVGAAIRESGGWGALADSILAETGREGAIRVVAGMVRNLAQEEAEDIFDRADSIYDCGETGAANSITADELLALAEEELNGDESKPVAEAA